MSSSQEFSPNWVSAPGDTIADILREKGISVDNFAERMRQAPVEIRNLIDGRATITLGLARSLEIVLGGSVEFWMARDFQYREDSTRLKVAEQEWLAELPVGDMIKFGWLNPI